MRKVLGGIFRLIFWLLIAAAFGYNTWQINVLRAEVQTLKRERVDAVQKGGGARGAPDGGALLARARRHAEQAQGFLRKKEYADAQRELRAATDALGRVSRGARDAGAGTLAELRGTLRSLSDQAEALWQRREDPAARAGKESEKKP